MFITAKETQMAEAQRQQQGEETQMTEAQLQQPDDQKETQMAVALVQQPGDSIEKAMLDAAVKRGFNHSDAIVAQAKRYVESLKFDYFDAHHR